MKKQRVLVIDDDHAHLVSTRGLLQADGYEVHTQLGAFGATNAIAAVKPDLILLDVNMPALSGEDLAALIRGNARTRTSRVLLHSSNDEDSLREMALRLQLDGYVSKGSPAALRIRVASVLGR